MQNRQIHAGCSVIVMAVMACCFPASCLGQVTPGDVAGDEWSNVIQMKFCWCPPGKFKMGDAPVDVTLTRGFWMGKYELTQEQYSAVMKENPSKFENLSAPVEYVTWTQAREFCSKLTVIDRASGLLPLDWEYRLPTEAEWEYACRAGTTTAYSFGDDVVLADDYAWYFENSNKTTYPVGRKKPNDWGFHDMHGNVSEWCLDGFQRELPGGTDPVVTQRPFIRVYRGGSWRDSAGQRLRSAHREANAPGNRLNGRGFRVVLVRSRN